MGQLTKKFIEKGFSSREILLKYLEIKYEIIEESKRKNPVINLSDQELANETEKRMYEIIK